MRFAIYRTLSLEATFASAAVRCTLSVERTHSPPTRTALVVLSGRKQGGMGRAKRPVAELSNSICRGHHQVSIAASFRAAKQSRGTLNSSGDADHARRPPALAGCAVDDASPPGDQTASLREHVTEHVAAPTVASPERPAQRGAAARARAATVAALSGGGGSSSSSSSSRGGGRGADACSDDSDSDASSASADCAISSSSSSDDGNDSDCLLDGETALPSTRRAGSGAARGRGRGAGSGRGHVRGAAVGPAAGAPLDDAAVAAAADAAAFSEAEVSQVCYYNVLL